MRSVSCVVASLAGLTICGAALAAGQPTAERIARASRFITMAERVMMAGGTAMGGQWTPDGSRFRYARGATLIEVDPVRNEMSQVDAAAPAADAATQAAEARRAPKQVGSLFPRFGVGLSTAVLESPAPDGTVLLGVRDENLYLRSSADDSVRQLTHDGSTDFEWDLQGALWSPHGKYFAVVRLDNSQVTRIPLVRWLNPTPSVSYLAMPSLGAPLPRYRIYIGDVAHAQVHEVDVAAREQNLGTTLVHYRLVGFTDAASTLLLTKLRNDRQSAQLVAIDVKSGVARTLVTERSDTILVRDAPEFAPTLLESGRFLWKSDRSGWMQLYLHERDGRELRQLTFGSYPVHEVVHVDEQAGRIFFTASPDQTRPYDVHLMSASLQGAKARQLSSEPGEHGIQFSPSGRFYVDMHSSVSRSPVTELRAADGQLVRVLEKSTAAPAQLWEGQPPEEFSVLAADGKTRLHGVLYKPADFDPSRRYPVVQYVYGGPGVSVVQHGFSPGLVRLPPALAQLGFITFTLDSRGTPGRGKAFQDAAFHDFGTHQIDDYVAALPQLGATHPYMDLSRVGVFGRSYGGYITLRALLLAPQVYRVGVAAAPMSGEEVFVESLLSGLPGDSEPARRGRIVPLVDRLQGRLLMIAGTHDPGITFGQVMKLTNAFIRADKRIDMVILPEADHLFRNEGSQGVPDSPPLFLMQPTYEASVTFDYFVEYLLNGVRAPLRLSRQGE